MIGRPSERSMQLFDMCSYDLDSFQEFVQSPGFRGLIDWPDEELQAIVGDEEKLLAFAFLYLKQVLFGEITIPVNKDARTARLEAAKDRSKKRKEQMRRQRQALEDDKHRDES